jgi:hypothetical protein
MNQELANVIKIYSTGSHEELSRYLIGKSKDSISTAKVFWVVQVSIV